MFLSILAQEMGEQLQTRTNKPEGECDAVERPKDSYEAENGAADHGIVMLMNGLTSVSKAIGKKTCARETIELIPGSSECASS